jgi:EmrB/QacA subfamily drug resistance transporter
MTTPLPPHPGEANRRSRLNIIAGGILAAFLAALDTTALATVMPTIAEELGGLHLYSWVFAGYMILAAVSMPLWGKLADLYGKRRLFFASVAIFVLSSISCGLSGSITQLIVFRALQGIGAGGLSSIPFAIVSTAFPPHERGKALGAIASAWGVSSVLGPIIGSTIVLSLDWRWVFFVNVPVGIAAVAVVAYNYREGPGRPSQKIDYLGAALLCIAIVTFLLSLRVEEETMASTRLLLGVTALLSGLLFIWREARAPDPILHLQFFRARGFSVGNVLGFASNFAMYGIIAYIPLFAQITQGGSAMEAGAIITPMSLSWSLAAVVSGRLARRVGEVHLIRLGIVMMILGMVLARMASPEIPFWQLILVVVATGLGM